MNAAQFSVTLFAIMIAIGAPVACSEFQTNPDAGTAEVVLDYAVMSSNAAALAIETAQRAAETTYYVTQKQILKDSITHKWPRAAYDKQIAEVRAEWKPVWRAFKAVRQAHLTLTQAIELGQGVTDAVVQLSAARKDLAAAMARPTSYLKANQ